MEHSNESAPSATVRRTGQRVAAQALSLALGVDLPVADWSIDRRGDRLYGQFGADSIDAVTAWAERFGGEVEYFLTGYRMALVHLDLFGTPARVWCPLSGDPGTELPAEPPAPVESLSVGSQAVVGLGDRSPAPGTFSELADRAERRRAELRAAPVYIPPTPTVLGATLRLAAQVADELGEVPGTQATVYSDLAGRPVVDISVPSRQPIEHRRALVDAAAALGQVTTAEHRGARLAELTIHDYEGSGAEVWVGARIRDEADAEATR
ncbi:hypothetical protein [Allonocardiopsis opalescens]|uniref:Uncharacterized protein n=1 Tax=Allonocardiopsis opalescens TaxID=1144618 RepID=A0A2T0PPH2_9ACTN|nr:hypothetical protein [Allonocardiopsis opalescens]PRX90805.1 hypothetical protein CLV72_1161 [Allonocardiopsis opalescens]